jgi:hypothetical protein
MSMDAPTVLPMCLLVGTKYLDLPANQNVLRCLKNALRSLFRLLKIFHLTCLKKLKSGFQLAEFFNENTPKKLRQLKIQPCLKIFSRVKTPKYQLTCRHGSL